MPGTLRPLLVVLCMTAAGCTQPSPERGRLADPVAVGQRMIAFCDLEWEEQCGEFYRTERTVRTASNWQVRQPVYQRSTAKWKRYEPHLNGLLEADGSIRCEDA